MKIVYNNKNGFPVVADVKISSKRASRQHRSVASLIGDVPYRFCDKDLPEGEFSIRDISGRHDFPKFRLFIGDVQVASLSRAGGCHGMIISGMDGFSEDSIRDAVSFGTNAYFCESLQY